MFVAIFIGIFLGFFFLFKSFDHATTYLFEKIKIRKIRKDLPLFFEQLRLSISVGHSFTASLETIIPQLPTRLSIALTPLLDLIHQKNSLEEALQDFPLNKKIKELHTFSLVIPILLKNGSHLSDFLKKLEQKFKHKLQLEERIQAQTAPVYVQAFISSVLPWGTLFGFYIFSPTLFLYTLNDSFSIKIFLCAIILNIAGYFYIRTLSRKIIHV